jgi:hypothetical protein
MEESANFFNLSTDLLLPALVSTVVTVAVTFLLKWAEVWRSAEVAYRFEQKKKIKEALGKYFGSLLDTAEKVDGRLENLSGNHDKGWLRVGQPRSTSGYYFVSTIQRLMCFYEVVYKIEREAVALDPRYADSSDFEFLNFVAVFRWILSDVEGLFKGLPYDRNLEFDHLYADSLKDTCARFTKISDRDRHSAEMHTFLDSNHNEALFDLISGIKPLEGRKRWDRFVALHLLLSCFQDRFGHKRHQKSVNRLQEIASRTDNPIVLQNMVSIVRNYALSDCASGLKLIRALELAYHEKTGSFPR